MKKRHFFEVGDKVQWESRRFPNEVFDALHGTTEPLYGIIKRIEPRPSPDFLDLQTREDWEWYRSIRRTIFWVEIENLPELTGRETPFRYRELRPLQTLSTVSL